MLGNDLQLVDVERNRLHKVFLFSDLFVNFNLIFYEINYQMLECHFHE